MRKRKNATSKLKIVNEEYILSRNVTVILLKVRKINCNLSSNLLEEAIAHNAFRTSFFTIEIWHTYQVFNQLCNEKYVIHTK
jgi:hypothetical protein